MLKRLCDKLHIKKNDNKGSAIVVVILAIAFVGMLVAMIVYMSYINYLMKYTDRSAKNNFYSAETALDEINAGLQGDISTSMTYAYNEVMKNASIYTTDKQKEEFAKSFAKYLKKELETTDGGDFEDHLKSYWVNTPIQTTPGGEGATLQVLYKTNLTDYFEEDLDDGYVALKSVKITYTNDKGFVSIIETDIVVTIPGLDFAANTEKPDLQYYSLIANENLIKSGGNTATVAGNVYGGKEGIQVSNQGTLEFKYLPDDDPRAEFRVTAASVNVSNRAKVVSGAKPTFSDSALEARYTDDNGRHQMWLENINLTTADVDLDGKIYVGDDLNVDGTDYQGVGSNVKLSGAYYGYGDSAENADGSSSILINGAQTSIDMSNLKELMLSGHAYVGARHYNADTDQVFDYEEDTVSGNSPYKNEDDIMLGQSLALKSDQLMYLVPTDCMCYDTDTDKQVLAKNPLTYDEYLKFETTMKPVRDNYGNIITTQTPTEKQYAVVDLSKIFNKMNVSLQATYNASCKKVFRKVNGSILVYYYLVFNSEREANQFFSDYYTANPESLQKYTKSYIREFKFNNALTSADGSLSLAGNMLYFDSNASSNTADVFMFKDDTIDEEAANNTTDLKITQKVEYQKTFDALNHYLVKNRDTLTGDQLTSDVYTNIVIDRSEFSAIVGGQGAVKKFSYPLTPSGEVIALAINNSDSLTPYSISSSEDAKKASIIIASGSVQVDVAIFKGLIIAGKDIIVTEGDKNISYDANTVIQAMMASSTTPSGDTKYFYELLKNGISYANLLGVAPGSAQEAEITAAREKDYVVLSDLIQYRNWKKE